MVSIYSQLMDLKLMNLVSRDVMRLGCIFTFFKHFFLRASGVDVWGYPWDAAMLAGWPHFQVLPPVQLPRQQGHTWPQHRPPCWGLDGRLQEALLHEQARARGEAEGCDRSIDGGAVRRGEAFLEVRWLARMRGKALLPFGKHGLSHFWRRFAQPSNQHTSAVA